MADSKHRSLAFGKPKSMTLNTQNVNNLCSRLDLILYSMQIQQKHQNRPSRHSHFCLSEQDSARGFKMRLFWA
jgi:hypothetical protein